MHFRGGKIIPRRVLCPWRARHLLASTLPAVARATAACFVRCEWMVGRDVGLLGVSSSHWCIRSSTGRDNHANAKWRSLRTPLALRPVAGNQAPS